VSSAAIPSPVQLERAATLRRLAREMEALRVLDVHRRAGPDTWVGPTAQCCLDELLLHRRAILAAADSLRAAARRLECAP